MGNKKPETIIKFFFPVVISKKKTRKIYIREKIRFYGISLNNIIKVIKGYKSQIFPINICYTFYVRKVNYPAKTISIIYFKQFL